MTGVGSPGRFTGRVAIVTGSTAEPSIGRACAIRLARDGASVVINGRDQERLDAAARTMRAEGFAVVGVAGSIAIDPTADVACASRSDSHDVPPFVDFHTPPCAKPA